MSKTMQLPCILLGGAPGKNTVGWVGLLGMDETSTNGDLYKCIRAEGNIYTWEKIGEGGSGNDVVSGYVEIKTAPAGGYEYSLVLVKSNDDVVYINLPNMGLTLDDVVWLGSADPVYGDRNQLYINQNTGELWVCTSVDSEGNANWLKISSVTDAAIKEALGYTPARQEDVAQINLQKSDAIIESATGEVIAVSDSAASPLRGLVVYGKSTQDGTPTPDAPVPIVSVGADGTIDVGVYGRNLLTSNIDNWEDGTLSATGGEPAAGTNRVRTEYIYLPAGIYTISTEGNAVPGAIHVYNDITPDEWVENTTNTTKNTVEFTMEFPGYVRIVFVPKTGSALDVLNKDVIAIYKPMLKVSHFPAGYEPYTAKTLPISTPDGLCGIPVSSGGNYTDADGQQWVCDTVDFIRGVRVQRVESKTFDGTEYWMGGGEPRTDNAYHICKIGDYGKCIDNAELCNRLPREKITSSTTSIGCSVYNSAGYNAMVVAIRVPDVASMTVATVQALVKEWYDAGTPLIVYYALSTPIETPLTESELAAYAALRTNYPNTTIYADDGAGLAVQYKADTKLYIDKKFAELAAAVVNA